MTARQALELATIGGARVLGRRDIGSLEAGKCADFIAINLNRLDYAGALSDPLAAVIFCAPQKVDLSVVAGKVIISGGDLRTIDVEQHIQKHNRAAKRIAGL